MERLVVVTKEITVWGKWSFEDPYLTVNNSVEGFLYGFRYYGKDGNIPKLKG